MGRGLHQLTGLILDPRGIQRDAAAIRAEHLQCIPKAPFAALLAGGNTCLLYTSGSGIPCIMGKVKAYGLRDPEFIGGEVDLRINIYHNQLNAASAAQDIPCLLYTSRCV